MSIKHTLQFITKRPLNADQPLQGLWHFATVAMKIRH